MFFRPGYQPTPPIGANNGPIFFLDQLYPFQDQILHDFDSIETGFSQSGGTALWRGLLNYRFSDNLDFFANNDAKFQLWADRCKQALSLSTRWACQINQREDRYLRLNLVQAEINQKIEMINDIPSHLGGPWIHPSLGHSATVKNILANTITAVLDREAAKRLADIGGLCCRGTYSIPDTITGAPVKAARVFPVDLGRVLCPANRTDLVRWIEPPDSEHYI